MSGRHWRGVRTLPVERYPGSSPHPRAIGYPPRTLELYRAVGLNVPEAQRGFHCAAYGSKASRPLV
jgi:putative polyketide hydroxylase